MFQGWNMLSLWAIEWQNNEKNEGREKEERKERRKWNEGEGGNICNIISSIMTHLSLINIDIVISIVRAIDNYPHTNNNNNMGESNNSKLSWNNKHTHTHPRTHTHNILDCNRVAKESRTRRLQLHRQVANSSKQEQQRGGQRRGSGGSVLVPCRMWACLLRGRALAYWRTDRLPRVVVLLLLPVKWASYALSSPINCTSLPPTQPHPLPPSLSLAPLLVTCFACFLACSLLFLLLLLLLLLVQVAKCFAYFQHSTGQTWVGWLAGGCKRGTWGHGRTVNKPIDFKFVRSTEAKEAYKLVKKEEILRAISRKYAAFWAL